MSKILLLLFVSFCLINSRASHRHPPGLGGNGIMGLIRVSNFGNINVIPRFQDQIQRRIVNQTKQTTKPNNLTSRSNMNPRNNRIKVPLNSKRGMLNKNNRMLG
ncbi:unnamed protein product [Brachionus calyciflorus]|uniref:Uncharacterized protein n=1 Tax=Brachionus calyciflorus TaxID=104777 RepID=A0A813UXR4_9BILA|nr:unnamed protein product [Brachionus calyciflorus]